MSKRTLDSFFQPSPKKLKTESQPAQSSTHTEADNTSSLSPSSHSTYPFSIPSLPASITTSFQYSPAAAVRRINDRPHLDLLYYQPFITRQTANALFHFLRHNLFFYRVQYTIKRGNVETPINTPRFTTVFGVDETSAWASSSSGADSRLVEQSTSASIDPKKYKCRPRPIPDCLDSLRTATEAMTGEKFNFCLVNYYADGNDSISYHSDDERFLGAEPAIASFSLGDKRDFLMKPKPRPPPRTTESLGGAVKMEAEKPMKLALDPGDMVLMRGQTQANWLHSIPKRKGGQGDGGRINITFRRALVRGGTENYYQYNVGNGIVYQWNDERSKMIPM